MDYTELRENIYAPIREEGIFTWDWMYGGEYALASCYSLSQESKNELTYAAEQLGKVFAKTVTAVQTMAIPIFRELGIPDTVVSVARIPVLSQAATLIGRFDFARTARGWKMLEFNSDTPGGIVEAFYVNGKVCDYFGVEDPNFGLEADLTRAFRGIVDRYGELGYAAGKVVFAALDWHNEDAGTARYLMQQSGLSAKFVPLKDLRLYQGKLCALFAGNLEPVDILYRLHPLGMLGDDADADGFPTGAYVLQLVEKRELALINPPAAIIAQTKALQALIWNLHTMGEFFAETEHEIIENYMLPTYFDNAFLGKSDYVIKPVFGREGGNVRLYAANGDILEEECDGLFGDQLAVYQQMAELEAVEVETLNGRYCGCLLWGAFLLNGQASAINARVGGRITNDMSYFLPVCVK